MIIAMHAIAGGAGGVAVICFGGGHQHAPSESDHCELACDHDSSWPLPVPADEHEHDCGCVDLELTVAELLSVPKGHDTAVPFPVSVPVQSWSTVLVEAEAGARGPPRAPPRFNPGVSQRLAIVESVRLII